MNYRIILISAVMLCNSSNVVSAENDISDICEGIDKVLCEKILSRAVEKIKTEINNRIATHAFDKKAHKKPKAEPTPPLKQLFLGDLKFKAGLGYTDTDANTDDSIGNSISRKIKDTTARNIKIGYFNKPIVKDIRDVFGIEATTGELEDKLLSRLKFNMYGAYGNTISDPKGPDNFETKTETTYHIGLTYEIPILDLIKEY